MYSAIVNSDIRGLLDKTGIATSMLCILHCILTPLLAASLPVLAVTERGTHIGFMVALMAIGLLAFIPGYLKHGRYSMVFLGLTGLIVLCTAVFLPEKLASESAETVLTLVGGGFLIIAHMSNMYYCRSCSICGEQPCRSYTGIKSKF